MLIPKEKGNSVRRKNWNEEREGREKTIPKVFDLILRSSPTAYSRPHSKSLNTAKLSTHSSVEKSPESQTPPGQLSGSELRSRAAALKRLLMKCAFAVETLHTKGQLDCQKGELCIPTINSVSGEGGFRLNNKRKQLFGFQSSAVCLEETVFARPGV